MDTQSYLGRIHYREEPEADLTTLRSLHRAHMISVPFENLDIPLGRPIILALPKLYQKVVEDCRGGFCYELNGLFYWLLGKLGFRVEMLSARVHGETGLGPDFDHMLLLVDFGQRYIVDVGFGDSFIEPLLLKQGEQAQAGRSYRLVEANSEWILERKDPGCGWEPQYLFSLTPRRLPEYEAMCLYQQISPESSFTRKSICSRATPEGRVTLSNDRWIVTNGEERREEQVSDAEEYRTLLLENFAIDLDDDAPVERLLVGNAQGE